MRIMIFILQIEDISLQKSDIQQFSQLEELVTSAKKGSSTVAQ